MSAMTVITARKEKGFTLIELVMVIVILGILAAFALPRFADLGGEARAATLQGALGSVKSASAIAHSKWLAQGSPQNDSSVTPAVVASVTLEGSTTVNMTDEGYPTADSGIEAAAQLGDDFAVTASGGTATISADGATDSDQCQFQYSDTTGKVVANSLVTSGCWL